MVFFFLLLHYLEFSFEIQGWKKAAGIDFHLPPCFGQNLILQLILAKYSNRLLRGTSGENFCRTVITITVTVTVIVVVVVVIKAFPSRGFPILYSLGPHVHSLPHHPRLSPDGTLSQLINLHRHITIKKKKSPQTHSSHQGSRLVLDTVGLDECITTHVYQYGHTRSRLTAQQRSVLHPVTLP